MCAATNASAPLRRAPPNVASPWPPTVHPMTATTTQTRSPTPRAQAAAITAATGMLWRRAGTSRGRTARRAASRRARAAALVRAEAARTPSPSARAASFGAGRPLLGGAFGAGLPLAEGWPVGVARASPDGRPVDAGRAAPGSARVVARRVPPAFSRGAARVSVRASLPAASLEVALGSGSAAVTGRWSHPPPVRPGLRHGFTGDWSRLGGCTAEPSPQPLLHRRLLAGMSELSRFTSRKRR